MRSILRSGAVRAISDDKAAATRRLTHDDEARRGSAARLSLVLRVELEPT
jgi:hypothetical protein